MRIAACSGGLGDIVYSIPVMRTLGIKRMYVKTRSYGEGLGTTYSVIKPLLESQDIECLPCDGQFADGSFPDITYTHNFDEWRTRFGRDRTHIIKSMMLHFRCYHGNWNKPWLFNIPAEYAHSRLIFLTPRWRDKSSVDWREIVSSNSLTWLNTHFIGLKDDYYKFIPFSAGSQIGHYTTDDVFELATIIKGCDKLFCNQSVALTIAQGLGTVPYWLEVKPGKTNTLIYSPYEHILK